MVVGGGRRRTSATASCAPTHPATIRVPFEGVLALRPEEVDVGLELQLEDVLLVDAVRLVGGADGVAEQGEARQREVILPTTRQPLTPLVASAPANAGREASLTW